MSLAENSDPKDKQDWLCPNLTTGWQLGQLRDTETVVLQSKGESRRYEFDAIEGYALQHFTGQFTASQVQEFCHGKFWEAVEPNLILNLLQKLIDLGILEVSRKNNPEDSISETPNPEAVTGPRLKSIVQWIRHSDGYWLLRNPEHITFLQVDELDKPVIYQLGKLPVPQILEKYNITLEELQYLLQLLAAQGMLEGTEPIKPPRKFSLLKLLFFKFPLFNPDRWLTRNLNKVSFVFTEPFGFGMCMFLAFSAVMGLWKQPEILKEGLNLWTNQGTNLLLPFALLMMLVVSIHELGHAFTLKHYGGIVPEIGLMFICLLPGAYTNTTDSYALVKRHQRALVYSAGVICQIVIWAIALQLWMLSKPHSWWHTDSYLLMVAAQLTLILNLNPLNKFDGYYLAVALTGINNLRERSFQFYAQMLRRETSQEQRSDRGILALYAPCSLLYLIWAFGYLLYWVGNLAATNLSKLS